MNVLNLNDYEIKFFSIYESFAKTIRFILEKALQASDSLPQPQSIQCRAKGIKSLRRRLVEKGKLCTQVLEFDRRDLAGVRLIFYTNNDVERFLASSLVRENFEIEEDSTKIHHPTPENEGAQYRAIHYTVRLSDKRTHLPEYARFAGLRCEIQVQTILNHAWSETSHDIIYRNKFGDDGYGGKAMKGIERRFRRIMDDFLIPAGFEIQKAKEEYERILQGKEIFDRDIANLLKNAQNNNERYDVLSGLKYYALPNYDDLPAVYKGLKGALLTTVRAARAAESVPIKTPYANWEGYNADDVTRLVVEIVEYLRYVDSIGTLQLLMDIYQGEPQDDIRRQILGVVKNLSEYNIDVYNREGLELQMALLNHLTGMSDAEVDRIRPIALTIWGEAIKSDITGAKWKADSVVLRMGAIPVSDKLRDVRGKAIKALFSAYDRSTNDGQKREVLSVLDAATKLPNSSQYSNEHRANTLMDAVRIVDFMTERSGATSYEILQHMEDQFLYQYFRSKALVEDLGNRFGCQPEAEALVTAIIKFRDKINADGRFVRYKVLVGFESVYPDHWNDEKYDFDEADKYRREEAIRYIDEINAANENDWFDLIERCAETKSDDGATFMVFVDFISKLAERRPEVADRLITIASDNLRVFITYFLNGLVLSGRLDIYKRLLESELESAKNLAGVARHLRYSVATTPDFASRLLKQAIDCSDSIAVIECLLFSMEHYGTEKIADTDTFLRDAFGFLNGIKDSRWVSSAWFLKSATKFYEELSLERTAQVLENLGYVRQVDHRVERILARLAKRQPEAVWDYFGDRISKEAVDSGEEQFEAVPFKFHGLEKELSKDPQIAIRKGLAWFAQTPELFQYQGGYMLSKVFPCCTSEFATALADLVKSGDETEADFVLAIIRNYHGEISTHIVLKEITVRFSEDIPKLDEVGICIDNTDVVTGELGFADALRDRKKFLTEWLADERPEVKTFAEKHIAKLDRMIASEHRRAESAREMRNREFDEEDESNEEDGK